MAQSLITFNVLTKNVVLLDQMRKRLSTLGLLKEIEKNPTLFEHFFVHQGSQLTPDYVKELLNFGTSGLEDETNSTLEQLLTTFIDGCKKEELSDLLAFVTGTCFQTSALVPRSVRVEFTESDVVYSSACLMELKVPKHFVSQEHFNVALKAVIKGRAFNSP